MIDSHSITAVILAGGRGSRMGGADKGQQSFNGLPLALPTMMRLQTQQGDGIGELMINANRNLAAYEAFGVPVWPDTMADYAGPLAGFLTALERCETPFLFTSNPSHPEYVGELPLPDTAAIIARASGVMGSNRAYLEQMAHQLQTLDIHDDYVMRLLRLVQDCGGG